jgi:uncharacterized alkaline shock family protein YloU
MISVDVLGRYAADAAREVDGVAEVLGRRGAKVSETEVELRIAVEWGASIPEVAAEVQRNVRNYLERMARVAPAGVTVVVDEVAGP